MNSRTSAGLPSRGSRLSRTGKDRSPSHPLVGVLNWDPVRVGACRELRLGAGFLAPVGACPEFTLSSRDSPRLVGVPNFPRRIHGAPTGWWACPQLPAHPRRLGPPQVDSSPPRRAETRASGRLCGPASVLFRLVRCSSAGRAAAAIVRAVSPPGWPTALVPEVPHPPGGTTS